MIIQMFTLVLTILTVTVSAQKACERWADHKNFNMVHSGGACGQVKVNDKEAVSSRIYNAKAVTPGMFPWMALIRIDYGESLSSRCTGTVINEEYILTAAFCVEGKGDITAQVFLGVTNRDNFTDGIAETYTGYDYIVHPEYDQRAGKNNVALIKLDRKINFSNPYINYICLPTTCELSDSEYYRERALTVAGWGLTSAIQDTTTVRTAAVQWKRCAIYKFAGPCGLFPPDKTQVCAGNNEVTVCEGDAGSPLTYTNGDRVFQVGVLSFGSGNCTGTGRSGLPEYYTKVPSVMSWLLKSVGL